jgi:hypothetical protein
MSVLYLYFRIFTSKTFRMWSNIMSATCVLWAIACFITAILRCIPIEATWNPQLQSTATCYNFILFFEIIEPINCAQDLIIVLMPIGVIRRLQLSVQQKFSLSLIFVLGGL